MFGDAQTVSDEDNERAYRSFDAPTGRTTPPSPDDLGLPIAPSWGHGWAPTAAEVIEPSGWDLPEPVRTDPTAPEVGGFAGWGGLSSTDQAPVTQDLTGWDSPFDAVVAEAADAPWDLDPAAETPVWGIEAAETPAWPSLPNPPSSAASAWAPGTLSVPLEEDPGAAVNHAANATVVAAAPHPEETSTSFAPPPTMSSWTTSTVATPTERDSSDREVSVDEAAGLSYSGVPFHELAAALAASEPTPVAEPIPAVAPATLNAAAAADPSMGVTNTPPKRRGRLAARSAQRNTAPVEVETDVVAQMIPSAEPAADISDEAARAEPVDMDAEAPLAMPTVGEHLVAGAETDEVPVSESSEDSAGTDEIAELGRSRGFFAKRDPRETASPSRETPKVLRIAAVVSLLIGLGLFGYSVLTSRSSDTKPSVATTTPAPVAPVAPGAEAPGTAPVTVASLPAAPIGEAGTVTELSPDPIFGGAPTTPSAPTSVEDPIFGADRAAASRTPADSAAAADPLFGTPPAPPTPDGKATGSGELNFDQPATAGR